FTPTVNAFGGPAQLQPVSGSQQAIADVVVVAIAQRFVEQANPAERFGAIDGVAGTHVIGIVAVYCRVSLRKVEAHRPRAERRAGIAYVASLRGSDVRIFELQGQRVEPARLQDDVLIDLRDERKTRRADSCVDGRRGAAPLAGDHAQGVHVGKTPK